MTALIKEGLWPALTLQEAWWTFGTSANYSYLSDGCAGFLVLVWWQFSSGSPFLLWLKEIDNALKWCNWTYTSPGTVQRALQKLLCCIVAPALQWVKLFLLYRRRIWGSETSSLPRDAQLVYDSGGFKPRLVWCQRLALTHHTVLLCILRRMIITKISILEKEQIASFVKVSYFHVYHTSINTIKGSIYVTLT